MIHASECDVVLFSPISFRLPQEKMPDKRRWHNRCSGCHMQVLSFWHPGSPHPPVSLSASPVIPLLDPVYSASPPSSHRLAHHESTACFFPYTFMVSLPCMVELCGDSILLSCFRLISLIMIKQIKREKLGIEKGCLTIANNR